MAGVESVTATMVATFLLTMLRQHPYLLVRGSTFHDLLNARWCMHPDMTRYWQGPKFYCRVHNTNHGNFWMYMTFLGVTLYYQKQSPTHIASHPMAHSWGIYPWYTLEDPISF